MNSGSVSSNNLDHNNTELTELRKLLIEPTIYERFLKTEEEIENLSSAEYIGLRLGEAFTYCQKNNIPLDVYLGPIIAKSIEHSIKVNRDKFIETLYPLLGDLIKRSVNQSLKTAFDNINILIEKAFSVDFIKWKIESIRTGVPFSDIVYKKGFLYKVEHLLVVHKASAQVIANCSLPEALSKNSDNYFQVSQFVIQTIKNVFWNKSNEWQPEQKFKDHQLFFIDSPYAVLCACSSNKIDLLGKRFLKKIFSDFILYHDQEIVRLTPNLDSSLILDNNLKEGLISKPAKSSLKKIGLKTKMVLAGIAAFLLIGLVYKAYWFIDDMTFNSKINLMQSTLRLNNNFLMTHFSDDENRQILIQGLSNEPEQTVHSINEIMRNLNLDTKKLSLDVQKSQLVSLNDYLESKKEFLEVTKALENLSFLRNPNGIDVKSVASASTLISHLVDLAKKMNLNFFVVIKYPTQHKNQADTVFIQLLEQLRKERIFRYHLVQTVADPKSTEMKFSVIY